MPKPLRLKAENLSCERGGRVVFKHLNFSLGSGELLELRGPNGSGKSSLLRVLAGLNIPVTGSIKLEGANTDQPLAEQTHYVGHSEANKSALTLQENLDFWTEFLGGIKSETTLSAFQLATMANDQAALLSSGQKRRLALSRLITSYRPLWLLDEPAVGLDASSVRNLQAVVEAHLSSGGMVIAATHTDLGMKSTHQLELEARQ